jgi:hypothetical protein
MSITKIHINIKQGIIEAEGSEDFVEKIYEDFKERIKFKAEPEHEEDAIKGSDAKSSSTNPRSAKAPKKQSAQKPKSKGGAMDASLVKDLDLTGGGENESLREFCAKYVIKTNLERNLVFTYYLANVLKIEEIGINHLFTCYRNIPSTKLPGNLKQSIYDTSSKGWIAVRSIDSDISVPVMGLNHIEHDLPKAGAS